MQETPKKSSESETEEQLVNRAQESLSSCRWVVGECAAKWTKKFARGRTDADFGNLIGLSGDQVYQRRRVWESFSDVSDQYSRLKWSHFYTALNWDDAMDCLQWADETESSVAEMKAWRRAQRGDDLTVEPDLEEYAGYQPLGMTTAHVVDPESSDRQRRLGRGESPPFDPTDGSETPAMSGLARDLEQRDDYAPFRSGAMVPQGSSEEKVRRVTPPLTTEQLAKRICTTLERCAKAINEQFNDEFADLPGELRERLLDALDEMNDKFDRFRK